MKKPPITITCHATVGTINGQMIVLLPEEASVKLPSRGQVYVTGMLDGQEFSTVLEPDGRWSHWIRVDDALQRAPGLRQADKVSLTLTTKDTWPEPKVPPDVADALEDAPQKVQDKWHDITPMARWEWIRWINATARDETRAIRIEKTISKLAGTHRRPCCFNLAACTDPELSRSGRLMEVER